MNTTRLFYFFILCFFSDLIYSQNYISISVTNGNAVVRFFPPAGTFANPFYSYPLPLKSDGVYSINLDKVTNKELAFLINDQDIYIYVGVVDTIDLIYDVAKKSFSFFGDNAALNKIYNLENLNRDHFKNMLEAFVNIDEQDGIARLLRNEIERLKLLFSIDEKLDICAQTYVTSRLISMIFWIKEKHPSSENFKNILPTLLKIANIDNDIIKNCLRNFMFYQTYYSTLYSNDLQNVSSWLSEFGYIFYAPEDIRDFVLQTNYIGNYNFARNNFNWCRIYGELEKHISKIYYTDFFQDHKPCK